MEFCQSEKSIWPHPKSLSALSLFVNLGNSEESLSSVCSAATLALLCFAIDPRQSDIHTTLGFQQRKFSSILRYLPLKKLYKKTKPKSCHYRQATASCRDSFNSVSCFQYGFAKFVYSLHNTGYGGSKVDDRLYLVLKVLCFPVDPWQSDIHITLGFQQNSKNI